MPHYTLSCFLRKASRTAGGPDLQDLELPAEIPARATHSRCCSSWPAMAAAAAQTWRSRCVICLGNAANRGNAAPRGSPHSTAMALSPESPVPWAAAAGSRAAQRTAMPWRMDAALCTSQAGARLPCNCQSAVMRKHPPGKADRHAVRRAWIALGELTRQLSPALESSPERLGGGGAGACWRRRCCLGGRCGRSDGRVRRPGIGRRTRWRHPSSGRRRGR